MNPKPLRPDPDVESLVRAYLLEQEQAVDAQRLLAAVRAKGVAASNLPSLEHAQIPFAPRVVRASVRWGVAVAAASVLMIFAWNTHQASVRADAVRLVRGAREALEPQTDRLYRIRIKLAQGAAERFPFLAALAPFDCRLWTRSDRFWIEAKQNDWTWACGRDEQGRAWIAPTSETGLFFVPEEVPEPLSLALELCNFDLETILDLLLTDFDTTVIRDDADSIAGVTRVRGTLKPDRAPRRFRSAEVEIDEETKRVRRVVLARMHLGRAVAQMSFTFDQSGAQPEQAYRLSGHLGSDSITYGPDQRFRRRRELLRFCGSLLVGE